MARPKPPAPTPASADDIEIALYEAMRRGDLAGLMALWSDDDEICCIHPGGKRILQAIYKSLRFTDNQLQCSYDVLREAGNLSSASILFVLKKQMQQKNLRRLFGAAFGPGLTVETFTAHS